MPKLSVELWAALTAVILGIYYYIKARFADSKISALKAALETEKNKAANQDIDTYIAKLGEKVKKARESYETEKSANVRGFVGPTDGNA